MDSFEFADSRTKRIHQKLSNQNAKEYGAYLEKIMNIPFDFGENRISNDLLISLDCFQAVEIYSRANKKKLRRIFANFIKLNAQKKEKYNSLIDDAEKSIRSLVDQTDLSYKTWMKDYRMSYNSKYLSTIDISLDSVGPSLFRIIYNFYLSDLARYKYWMRALP